MFGMISGFEFLNLPAFWAACAMPFLILAYLRRQRRKQVVVSSLLLLETLTKRRIMHRRFKPPLRFFLEFAALLALVIGAAAPLLKQDGSRVALVVDNSLSMQAKTESAELTRLALAVQQLQAKIVDQPGDKLYTVYQTSPKLARVGERDLPRADVGKILKSIQPTWAGDTLELSVLELGETENFAQILVASDVKIIEQRKPPAADAAGPHTEVHGILVGQPSENPFIAGAQLTEDSGSGKRKVVVGIGLSGQFSMPLEVILSKKRGTEGALVKSVTAQPNKVVELNFEVPSDFDAGTVLRADLKAEAARDALEADNTAWVSASASSRLETLIVSAEAGPDVLGLDQISGLQPTVKSAAEFARLSEADLNRFGLIVFHKTAPAYPPNVASLLIVPPGNNALFSAADEVDRPKITSWSEESPITRYLRVPLLKPSAAVVFKVPAWAQAVMSVEQGPIIVSGESRGIRYAAVGIELLPFEGRRTPSESILALNLLGWLSGGRDLHGDSLTGTGFRLDSGKTWVIQTPQGAIQTLEVKPDETKFFQLEQPGSYVFSSIAPGTTKAEQANKKTIPVNAFYPEESATFSQRSLIVPQLTAKETALAEAGRPVWNYLAWAALLVVLSEFLLFWRLPRRASEEPAAV